MNKEIKSARTAFCFFIIIAIEKGLVDPVSKDYIILLPEILARASEAALEFVTNGLNMAMNKFNGSIDS